MWNNNMMEWIKQIIIPLDRNSMTLDRNLMTWLSADGSSMLAQSRIHVSLDYSFTLLKQHNSLLSNLLSLHFSVSL
jgi:hypothetical protein